MLNKFTTDHACCNPQISENDKNRCLSVKQMLEIQDDLNSQLDMGRAWSSILSEDHYYTAIIGELGEIIDQPSSPAYKWWKQKDPETYSPMMLKLELIDIVHFYLSIAIINIRDTNQRDVCAGSEEFGEFEYYYIGSDRGNHFSDIGLVFGSALNHSNYMKIVRDLVCSEFDFYGWVDVLDKVVSSGAMTCSEMSALYTAKATLNSVRWEHPEWEKVDKEGVEDNERLFPLVQAFLDDETQTLTTLKEALYTEFYGQ